MWRTSTPNSFHFKILIPKQVRRQLSSQAVFRASSLRWGFLRIKSNCISKDLRHRWRTFTYWDMRDHGSQDLQRFLHSVVIPDGSNDEKTSILWCVPDFGVMEIYNFLEAGGSYTKGRKIGSTYSVCQSPWPFSRHHGGAGVEQTDRVASKYCVPWRHSLRGPEPGGMKITYWLT